MLNHSININQYRKVILTLIFASILILLPSFILLTASSWNSDDYNTAKLYQVKDLYEINHRIFNWSPRFFSEMILYVYYNTVPWLGRPLTGAMILITWLFLLCSIFIFSRSIISNHSLFLRDTEENLVTKQADKNHLLKILLPLLITLILFIYCLYCYLPSEMYYLVIVSVPYISTLAGIIFNLTFYINQANSPSISNSKILQLILFGIITASSWEMGAIYQFFLSISLFFLLLLTSVSTQFHELPFSRLNKLNRWKIAIANFIPFFLSLYIFFLLKLGRLTGVDPSSIGSQFVDNFQASFITSILQFFKELFFLNHPSLVNSNVDFYFFSYSVVYKLGFLLLLIILFSYAKIIFNNITKNACLISIINLLITNFITTFSGYYELGIASPGRQMSFKLALIGLSFFLIAMILASSFVSQKTNIKLSINSPVTLLITFSITIALLVNLQFNNLKQDILNINNIITANNQDWQSNLDSHKSFATYTYTPTYYIFRMYFEPGLYHVSNKPENYRETAYLNYFNKQKLYVTSLNNK